MALIKADYLKRRNWETIALFEQPLSKRLQEFSVFCFWEIIPLSRVRFE
jgi:hypothetical protein